jgi:hypothetical protein
MNCGATSMNRMLEIEVLYFDEALDALDMTELCFAQSPEVGAVGEFEPCRARREHEAATVDNY